MVNYGKDKKYHIRTYGCQSNVRDTETMMGMCDLMGYTWVDEPKEADLVILNTCAIRENAEKKVFGEIGFLQQIRKYNPNFVFGVAGCMSQEEHVVKKILDKNQHIDFIIGTHNIHRLPQVLEQVAFDNQMVVEVWSQEGNVVENLPVNRNSKIKAWVNIMYGCDKFCTYCIVPYTRGKIRSRSKQDIIQEINDLIKQGYQEITLLGQNVNSYGIDFKEDYNFVNLLIDVANTKIERIRFATSNPWNWTNEMVDIIKQHKNIMPYIHLPVQSGNEDILAKMNRPMKMEDLDQKSLGQWVSCAMSYALGWPCITKLAINGRPSLDMLVHTKFFLDAASWRFCRL